ncbi:MAG TPA: hypothetical protein VKG02_06930 [Blastocatellia bacterium]|nr:hypothetical protein [Blastocatellia bacterium]
MKKLLITPTLFLWAASAALQAQPALSNSDVIKMANSGLSDDFIINLIDQQGSHLSGDVASLIDMKKAGVNERILAEVTKKAPSQEPLNSDSVVRLVRAQFSDNFIAGLIMSQPGKFSVSGARVVELKEAGVSERLLSLMVNESGAKTLPGGTAISVRLIDSIDSEKDKAGDEFRASLEDPIKVGDAVVAPKGSDARVRLVEDKQSGKFTGRAELTIQLLSFSVNGKTVPVETASVSEYSKSQGASTAKKAAAVGAVGAVIGALAGGGKGAAIGAGAGAAAGAGSGVFMKGQRVKIPSETLLTFTTQQDVRIP